MRAYEIVIIDPDTNLEITRYSAFNENNRLNPNALNIEFDIPVYNMATSVGQAGIRIWGIGILELTNAGRYFGKNIQVYAGMSEGLPLANPKQYGLILEGTIIQVFGNWQDVNQTIDFVVTANYALTGIKNLSFNWPKGTQLSDAIRSTLNIAFSDYTATINISPVLASSETQPAYFATISEFAVKIKEASAKIVGGNGVEIAVRGKQFIVYDGTTESAPKAIQFNDMIGQATWLSVGTIQFKTVMRYDLSVGDYVVLPNVQARLIAKSYAQYRQNSVFQGSFLITNVRHVASYRQPDANSWVTVIDAIIDA